MGRGSIPAINARRGRLEEALFQRSGREHNAGLLGGGTVQRIEHPVPKSLNAVVSLKPSVVEIVKIRVNEKY